MSDDAEKWQRRFERERAARREAERLLEVKSTELFQTAERLRRYTSEQSKTIAEAEAEIAKLSMVASRTANGVIITDRNGLTEWVNEGFTRLSGFTLGDLIGRTPGSVLQGPETDPATTRSIGQAIRAGHGFDVEVLNYRKRGGAYWVQITADPIRDEAGEIVRYIAIQTDITARKDAEEELRHNHSLLNATLDVLRNLLAQPPQDFEHKAIAALGAGLAPAFRFDVLLWFSNEDRQRRFRLVGSWGRDEETDGNDLEIDWSDGFDDWYNLLASDRLVAMRIGQAKEQARALLERFGLNNIIAGPLRLGREFSGFLMLGRRDSQSWEPSELKMTQIAIQNLALVCERSRAIESLRDKTASLDRLNLKLQQEIQRANLLAAEAAEANQAKSRFLATMSHEIRTPLNGILGYAQVLKNAPELTPDSREKLDIVRRSGQHLLLLINDILDLSKIESGRFQTHFEVVELQAFLNDLLLMIRPKAVGRGLSLELRLGLDGEAREPQLPRYLELDTRALRQILVNLLGNAVKFTDRGGVTLRCYRHAADVQDKTCLRFEVEDTGIGIEDKDIDRIFDDFHQADHAHASEGGTGLGLAISSRLARLLGGTLRVESRRGQGSRFFFDLHATPSHDSPRVTTASLSTDLGSITGYRGPQRRILVIDDNPDNRRLLVDMLEPVGFHIETANDGEHGLEKAAAFRPDAVLCDLFMPRLDGFGFLARFREHAPGIPVVAISASVHPASDEIERFAAFLRKPVDGGELFYTLGKLLGLRWDHQSPPGPDEAPDACHPPAQLEAAVLPAPEPEVLAQLIELAELGDIEGVKAVAASLEASHPRIASTVLNRAKQFQTEKLIEELRPMLSRHVD